MSERWSPKEVLSSYEATVREWLRETEAYVRAGQRGPILDELVVAYNRVMRLPPVVQQDGYRRREALFSYLRAPCRHCTYWRIHHANDTKCPFDHTEFAE